MNQTKSADIIVVGAGAAGIAAAVAAAESGSKVILVEHYGFVGGLATSAMVGTICGLFYRDLKQATYAVQGFARTFAEGLQAKSQTQIATFAQGLHFLPYQISTFHQQGLQALQQVGVELLLHSDVISVSVVDNNIVELQIKSSDRLLTLKPLAVIDCSGNAQISMLAGLERLTESHYQAGAFVFQVSGLPEMESRLLSLNLLRGIKRGIQQGNLEAECDYLSLVPNSIKNSSGLFKLGLPKPYNGNFESLTEYELEARSRSVKIVEYLQRSEKLFSDLNIISMATQVGIRSSARPQGLELLNEQQVLECVKPDNGIAIGAWPIEYWGLHCKPEMRYFNLNDAYWIPAGALVSKSLNNLFFAGRAISATEQAIASARVIGTCLQTGYASGILASEFTRKGSWQSAIEKIQHQQIFTTEV